MKPDLTILIATLHERHQYLARLMERFVLQADSRIIIKTDLDGGEITIGEKRNRMLKTVETPFCCFFDDDDLPSHDYSSSILKALDEGADVVGFRLYQYTDGHLTGYTIHSMQFERWVNEKHSDGYNRHIRTPNHLNPVRTELAQSIGFKALQTGEDADFSQRLYAKHKKNMREVFVDKYLYHYLYRSARTDFKPIDVYKNDHLTRDGMEAVIRNGGSVILNGRLVTKMEQLDADLRTKPL